MNVQAYILTLTYHTTLDEIMEHIYDCKCDIITYISILQREDTEGFVAPKWATEGDVVFFYFAKSSINSIKKLKKECDKLSESDKRKKVIQIFLDDAEKLYYQFGGCIFAVGRVCGNSEIGETYEHSHFKNNIFAPVTDFVNLETVIPLECFSEYAPLEFKKSITPVLGDSFEQLKQDILEDDYIDYLENSHSVPIPLKDISKDNWLNITMDYRRKFFLEIQFRKYYVDYFLSFFGDFKKFYMECACFINGRRTGVADNFTLFNKKYIAIEVKLNINTVCNFKEQLEKYCSIDNAKLSEDKSAEKEEIEQNYVFIIDVIGFYVYNHKRKEIKFMEKLDNIKSVSDIKKLREKCIKMIK